MTQHGIDHESVEEYIADHLPSSDGTWELVFFPNDEPEPTGVNEDHTNMVEIMDMIEGEFDDTHTEWPLVDDTHTEEEYLAEKGTDDWVKHLEQQGANPFKQHALDQRGTTDASGQLHHRRRADRRMFRPHEDGWDNRSASGCDRRWWTRRTSPRPRVDDRFLGR